MMELRSRRNNNNEEVEDAAEGEDEEEESTDELPPGLSALIEAATSQLGHFIEGEEHEVVTDPPTVSPPPPGPLIESHHSFPERLMRLCSNPDYVDVITFLPDGKFFAVRVNAFCEIILRPYFDDLSTFDHFVTRAEQWGFSKLGRDGIAIFRHPSFVQGDYELCSAIQFGESPSAVRMQALPDRARSICSVEESASSPSPSSSIAATTAQQHQSKRQLSPRTRRESLSSMASTKARVDDSNVLSASLKITAQHEESNSSHLMMDEDSVRSVAMAITTDRLKLQLHQDSTMLLGAAGNDPNISSTSSLVETAVSSATHEIVTDAIESLLRDEGHSQETYAKHAKELSRSSIPGVVPVCKQLFCSTYKDALQIVAMDQTTRGVVTTGPDGRREEPQQLQQASSGDDSPRPAATSTREQEEKVLKEASNSPSTTHATISVATDDRKVGLPRSIPEML
jgi:HSF-type DNA-binding